MALSGLTVTSGAGTLRLNADAEADSEALRGGGVDAMDAASLTIDGCRFEGNAADYGAGVYGPTAGPAVVSGSAFADNVAALSGGLVVLRGEATVSEVEFLGEAVGGATHLAWIAEVTIEDSALPWNHSASGGGLYAWHVESLDVTDSRVDGNQADAGGGLYLYESGATIEASDVTQNDGDGLHLEGGAVRSIGSDWGIGDLDNDPRDLRIDGGAYDFGDDADFVCDTEGCE